MSDATSIPKVTACEVAKFLPGIIDLRLVSAGTHSITRQIYGRTVTMFMFGADVVSCFGAGLRAADSDHEIAGPMTLPYDDPDLIDKLIARDRVVYKAISDWHKARAEAAVANPRLAKLTPHGAPMYYDNSQSMSKCQPVNGPIRQVYETIYKLIKEP